MATITSGDIVRVVNRGGNKVTVMYDSRPYVLEPGADVFMPIEAAILWFGDPRANQAMQSLADERGIRSYIPDRESEVRRLRVKYDNQFGDERVISNHPIVDVFTLDGERLPMVLDDPSGEQVILAQSTQAQAGEMRALIDRQQRQIDLLMQHLANTQQTTQMANMGIENVSPIAPGRVQPQETGPDASVGTSEPTMTMPAPQIPGIPSTPPPPDDLMDQVVTNLPQDGDVVTDLPRDGESVAETPPADVPPSSPDPSAG